MPSAIKPYAKKIVETMLTTKDKAKTDKVLNDAYDTFKKLPIEDIAAVMGISSYDKWATGCREFTTMKGMPYHVKAAYFYNHMLKLLNITHKYESLTAGDKLRFINVRQPNRYGIKIIGYKYYFPSEFVDIFEPDYDFMFEKLLFAMVERFYQSVNWQIRLPSMNTQTNLLDLFS